MSYSLLRVATFDQDISKRLIEIKADPALILSSRERVRTAEKSEKPVYGVNTGFGALATTKILPTQLSQLQKNLLISHAVGVGPAIPKEISRRMMQLKVASLSQGYSGVSWPVVERLFAMLDQDLIPVVPEKGSVGASGDLAPLAHMALPLIGMGEIWDSKGAKAIPAAERLQQTGLKPIELQSKDGLALINGTQFMLAYGLYVLEKALPLLKSADILGAMSLEALQGSIQPFDERVHQVRPHPGQVTVAANVRNLLQKSEILESHRNCGKVQDPYCLRCIPQVHGATRDALRYAIDVIETEMNSVTDNPLVFENGDLISGGNFHGQPLALALDFAKIALAELASISERRTYLLLEGHDGLPKLLMQETGINSGFMIPQYTAAALVSENKVLCHPSSVDSIPTSLGQEDHVSMGSVSAIHLLRVLENVQHVLAIELFTAAQALDFRKPLKPGTGVEKVHQFIRTHIPFADSDRPFQEDLKKAIRLLENGRLLGCLSEEGLNLI